MGIRGIGTDAGERWSGMMCLADRISGINGIMRCGEGMRRPGGSTLETHPSFLVENRLNTTTRHG